MTAADRTRASTNGIRLQVLRYTEGLTAEQVTERLFREHQVSIHPDHLRKLEKGRRNGSPKLLKALAGLYGTEVSDLLVLP